MSFSSNFSCDFKAVRSFFSNCDVLDVVINGDNVVFLSKKKSTILLWMFAAEVNIKDDDADTRGVTINSDLLFKLPSLSKGLDTLVIETFLDTVTCKVNDYKITLETKVFDRKYVDTVLKNITQQRMLQLKNLNWITSIGRHYKESTIEVGGKYVFCKTQDGLFVKVLDSDFGVSFGVDTLVISKLLARNCSEVSIGNTLTAELGSGEMVLAQLFKTSPNHEQDFLFAKGLKCKVKVTLKLDKHKELFKSLRGCSVTLKIDEQALAITTDKSEDLRIYLGNDCDVTIAESKDFNRFQALTEELRNVQFNSLTVLKAISNERNGVEVFVSAFINIVRFSPTCYLLMPRKVV